MSAAYQAWWRKQKSLFGCRLYSVPGIGKQDPSCHGVDVAKVFPGPDFGVRSFLSQCNILAGNSLALANCKNRVRSIQSKGKLVTDVETFLQPNAICEVSFLVRGVLESSTLQRCRGCRSTACRS